MIKTKTLLALLLFITVLSCENDPYSTGDGHLSRITTAFGETSFDSKGYAVSFMSDDDRQMNFTKQIGKPNENLAGTTMRSLLYYNITDDKNLVEPVSLLKVLTANAIDKNDISKFKDDPIKVEAVWFSANKKYLNLSLSIKTSTPKEQEMKHRLGMLYMGSVADTLDLRFIHDADSIDAYYSVKTYFSVPVRSFVHKKQGCSVVRVKANTYDGIKTFELEI